MMIHYCTSGRKSQKDSQLKKESTAGRCPPPAALKRRREKNSNYIIATQNSNSHHKRKIPGIFKKNLSLAQTQSSPPPKKIRKQTKVATESKLNQ
jgi:hypothetical protein